ncbi:unnamed protein product [Ostreobium quekettii]|uniref:Uncharacterized protein n=1 Tax=Ostreobium quekettii TaxID=121088 RepID=A0A8S1J1F9_9CHLO|nr:unnamed protein product [Ostreobium quekettii]|eukprot:evm.model.scf_38EXC.15 EVM.evm.TU.scf_38EXC.15   scf_38EXC:158507-164768(+)
MARWKPVAVGGCCPGPTEAGARHGWRGAAKKAAVAAVVGYLLLNVATYFEAFHTRSDMAERWALRSQAQVGTAGGLDAAHAIAGDVSNVVGGMELTQNRDILDKYKRLKGNPKVALMFLTKGRMHNEPVWRAFLEAASGLDFREPAPLPSPVDLRQVVGGPLKPDVATFSKEEYISYREQHGLDLDMEKYEKLTGDLPGDHNGVWHTRRLLGSGNGLAETLNNQGSCAREDLLLNAAINRLMTGDVRIAFPQTVVHK